MPALWGSRFTREELMQRIGRLDQVAGVRLVERADGMERGVRVLEFRTGSGFAFDVLVDRAMDIGRCEHHGRALGWQSPTGFIGPWYYEPEDLGWLRGFGGGLLTTCGMEHALFMAEDTATLYHYPPKQTERFGLHGRVSYLPATLSGYGARWDGDDCFLWAEGEVAQTAVFGENLLLRRRVEAKIGEDRLTIHDEVTNAGWNPTPRGDHSTEGYRTFHGPTEGYIEQVTEHDIHAEPDGSVPVSIANRAAGFGAYEIFNRTQLPHHFIWRMLGQGTYVVGIEPSTNRTSGRLPARESGELIILAPGEVRQYDLELGALPDGEAIEAFAARVEAIGAED